MGRSHAALLFIMSSGEPVAMRRHLKYILWFAQENVEFRAEELQSIAKTLNISMIPEPRNYSPRDVRIATDSSNLK